MNAIPTKAILVCGENTKAGSGIILGTMPTTHSAANGDNQTRGHSANHSQAPEQSASAEDIERALDQVLDHQGTGATALFLSNKYTTLLYNILGLITFYPAISDAVRNICSIIRALLTIVEEVRPIFSL